MSHARTELVDPASVGDERQLLVGFLDYFRTVFLRKVEDLDDQQARLKVPPSSMDLLGMIRHLADVERWWFRCAFTAETDTGIYESDDDPDLDWHHSPDDMLADALVHWHAEVARARKIVTAAPTTRSDRRTVHDPSRRNLAAMDPDPHDRGVRPPQRARRLSRSARRRHRRLNAISRWYRSTTMGQLSLSGATLPLSSHPGTSLGSGVS